MVPLTDDLAIREWNGNDLSECAHLFSEAYRDSEWHENWSHERSFSRLENILKSPGSVGLIAEKSETVVGFVAGRLEIRDDCDHFCVDELAVASGNRSIGIATSLMEALATRLRDQGCSRIYLLTRKDSGPVSFYTRLGYVSSGRMTLMGISLL